MTRVPGSLLTSAAAATLAACAATPPCPPVVAPAATLVLPAEWRECTGPSSSYFGAPAVVKYSPGTADSVRRPERVITGPNTLLCQPSAVAVGSGGEVYVLNRAARHSPDPSDPRAGPSVWVTVYDSGARDDAAPIRALEVSAKGFPNVASLGVDRDGYVYVGSGVVAYVDSGSVTVYAPGADGDVKPIRVIAGPRTGLRLPVSPAVDRRGLLYVAGRADRYPFDDTVRVFGPDSAGDVEPCRVIAGERTGLKGPVGLAVDRRDRLYVANGVRSPSTESPAVTVYEALATGDVPPLRTLTAKQIYDGMSSPRRVALDSHDSVYVRSIRSLAVFAPGSSDASAPARTFFRQAPDLFALDRHDSLYTVSGDTVMVYAPGYAGNISPVRKLGGPGTGLRRVTALALDRRGWLYVAVGDSSLIRVYAPGASGDAAPSRTIAGSRTRLRSPAGLTLDREGRLYATNGPARRGDGGGGAIRVYPPGARNQDPPVRVLRGPDTRLSPPTDIEFDSRQNTYVSGYGQVSVFPRSAQGDEAPLRTIAGSHTYLYPRFTLALGPGDTLYALNASGYECRGLGNLGPNATVTVYAPGASGDARPVRTLVLTKDGESPGRKTDPSGPRGLAVDGSGAVQVWYSDGAVIYAPGDSGAVAPGRTIQEAGLDRAEPGAVTVARDGTVYQTRSPGSLRLDC